MSKKTFIFLCTFLFIVGCAQVPQSSVILSNSIADDVVNMQKAHKGFINYYYNSLEQQANDLINNKYRPSLIRQTIEQDIQKFKSLDKKHQSVFNAIQKAFVDNEDLGQDELKTSQSNALLGMKFFYTKIDQKVELERKQLLEPLKKQRLDLLSNVDNNYANIVKKNAVITSLLNSVIDVHETQQKLFEMTGIKENVREDLGSKLANLADNVEKIQSKINSGSSKVEDVEKAIAKFKNLINK